MFYKLISKSDKKAWCDMYSVRQNCWYRRGVWGTEMSCTRPWLLLQHAEKEVTTNKKQCRLLPVMSWICGPALILCNFAGVSLSSLHVLCELVVTMFLWESCRGHFAHILSVPTSPLSPNKILQAQSGGPIKSCPLIVCDWHWKEVWKCFLHNIS